MKNFDRDAEEAFERTRPHELDERMRLASCPDDFSAIRLKKVRGVLWERPLAPKLLNEFHRISFRESGYFDVGIPHIQFSESDTKIISRKISLNGRIRNLPNLITKDISLLSDIFRRASNLKKFDTTKQSGNFLQCWHYEEPPSLHTHIAEFDTMSVVPHKDGTRDYRLLTTYATSENMATQWYPVSEADEMQLFDFSSRLYASEDPEGLLKEFNETYKAQSLRPGDVMVFKPHVVGRSADEVLIHSAPLPKARQARLALLLSCIV